MVHSFQACHTTHCCVTETIYEDEVMSLLAYATQRFGLSQ